MATDFAEQAWRRAQQDKMLRLRERLDEAADQEAARQPDPPEVQAVNRIVFESIRLAKQNPLFAAARSAASHYSIVPLEPGGATPILPASEGTRDVKKLLEWWQSWPEANVGLVVGRLSGVIAVRLSGDEGRATLRELATVRYRDPDTGRTYEEVRELPATVITIARPGKPVVGIQSTRVGWGKAGERRTRELIAEQRPEVRVQYLLFAYPEPGQDMHDYKARNLGPGLDLLGDGDVIPFAGQLLDGTVVKAPGLLPGVVPSWFQKYGKPRRNLK